MSLWSGGPPKTFEGLFDFYNKAVKGLYGVASADATLSQETLFEINAAFDHVSRRYVYGESEEQVVSKAYGHLKRSCLDLFKLSHIQTMGQFEQLRRVDTTLIDNGSFHKKLLQLHNDIQVNASNARMLEGQPDEELAVPAFEVWETVYEKCQEFRTNYYLSPHVEWARRVETDAQREQRETAAKQRKQDKKDGFVMGIVSGVIASAIFAGLTFGLTALGNELAARNSSSLAEITKPSMPNGAQEKMTKGHIEMTPDRISNMHLGASNASKSIKRKVKPNESDVTSNNR
jgi:hypothetical protein